MALFQGEDLVDITTPDGRTMTLPRSAVPASLLPQQQIGPAPTLQAPGMPPQQEAPMPSLAPPPDAEPQIPLGGAPSGGPTAVVDMGEPTTQRMSVRQHDVQVAKQKQTDAKAAKAQAAKAASPAGQMAGAQQQTQAGMDAEKTASDNAANVEAAAQDLQGQAMEQHNQKIDALLEKRAIDAQAAADAEQKKMDEIAGIRKKIAGTKIDRTADHPIIAALGVALADLGSAMQNRFTNNQLGTANLDMFWKALDRKVANQMADVDLMEKNYGLAKDELGSLKEMGSNKLEMYNALVAGEADKAKRHLEEISAKSASEKTRANAKILAAQIDQRASAAHSDAVRWGLEYDQRDQHQKQQLGLGYSQLAETKRSNIENAQLKREDMYLDAQKYMAQLKSSGDTEAYKAALKQTEEVGKRGVRDVNGDLLMTPQGRALTAQAKQLEDEAAKTEDAGKADPLTFGIKGGKQRVEMLREKAAQLRGEANNNGSVLAHSDTEAVTVSNMIASGQSTVQLIDGIKELSDQAGRGLISRDDAQAKLQGMFNQLGPNLKEAWQLGAWDKGSANLVASIIGADPSSDWNSGALATALSQKMYENPKAFKGRLDSVAEGLERTAKNRLVGLGAKFGKDEKVLARQVGLDEDSPTAKASAGLQGPTPVGVAEDLSKDRSIPGQIAGKVNDTLTYGVGPGISRDEQARNVEERNGSMKNIGLDKTQAQSFNTLLTRYKAGSPQDGDQLVASVANNAAKQPDLAVSLLHNLREFAPDLYVKARMVVPKGGQVDQQMSYEETSRIGDAQQPTQEIATMVTNTIDNHGKVTDQDGWRELARRATAGDKDAKKAILDIARQAGNIASLPNGSIFKENP
jgi:hypothetical protein